MVGGDGHLWSWRHARRRSRRAAASTTATVRHSLLLAAAIGGSWLAVHVGTIFFWRWSFATAPVALALILLQAWFSTGLFVLATGMRPWTHLVDRLNERTMELHDFIHYPESFSPRQGQGQGISDHDQEQMNSQVDDLQRRFAKLEKQFTKLKASIAHSTEEVYDYVDDLVENMEGTLRKQESRSEKVEGQRVCVLGFVSDEEFR